LEPSALAVARLIENARPLRSHQGFEIDYEGIERTPHGKRLIAALADNLAFDL